MPLPAGAVASTGTKATSPDTPKGFVEGQSKEILAKRNATDQVFENPDGTKTLQTSLIPRFWKDGSEWKPVDTTLAVKNGKIVSGANSFKVEFDPDKLGVTVINGKDRVGFLPVGGTGGSAAVVEGSQVTYKDVWPSVDVRYTVTSIGVTEDLIVKSKPDQASFEFAMTGAKVQGPRTKRLSLGDGRDGTAGKSGEGAQGADSSVSDGGLELTTNEAEPLQFEPPVVESVDESIEHKGARPKLTSTTQGVAVTVDAGWLNGLESKDFPLVIDPSIAARGVQSYTTYKSDGYRCTYSSCLFRIGNSRDGGDSYYRTTAIFNHNELVGKDVTGAFLSWGATPSPFLPGANGTEDMFITWAQALDYSGAGNNLSPYGAACKVQVLGNVGTDACEVTTLVQDMADRGQGGAYFGFVSPNSPGVNDWKQFLPTFSATYQDWPPPAPAPNVPPQVTNFWINGQALQSWGQTITAHTLTPTLATRVDDANHDVVDAGVAIGSWGSGGGLSPGGWQSSPYQTPNVQVPSGVLQWNNGYPVTSCSVDPANWSTNFFDWCDQVVGFFWPTNSAPDMPELSGLPPDSVRTSSPQLSASASDPNGDPVLYEFSVATNSDGLTGKVISSNRISSSTFQIPDGSIADGQYYWTARACDTYGFCSPWASASRFRVARRLGVVSTNPMDSAGPFSVNLSTGNLVAAAAGPSYKTMDGSAGVSFSYNSQVPRARGLTASYFEDKNANASFADNDAGTDKKLVQRIDSSIGFNWGSPGTGPAPGVVNPKRFTAEWTGKVYNPTGQTADWRIRVRTPDGGSTTNTAQLTVGSSSTTSWNTPTAVSLTANSSAAISLKYAYAKDLSGLVLEFCTQGATCDSGGSWAELPGDYLLPTDAVLPSGWSSTGPSLGSAPYSRLVVGTDGQVTMVDSSGAVHIWASTAGGYVPPPDDDGTLAKRDDGTFEFADGDGYVYRFNQRGELFEAVSPSDALNPAASTYTYGRPYASGPYRLLKITDAMGRVVNMVYGGPANDNGLVCPTGPGTAPAGMLCQVAYTGFTRTPSSAVPTTDLIYDANSNLARIQNPGDTSGSVVRPTVDFAYDGSGQLVGVRDVLTNDLIAQGAFTGSTAVDSHWWRVTYDGNNPDGSTSCPSGGCSRVTQIQSPVPTAADPALQRNYVYQDASTTLLVQQGATNDSGWTRKATFDAAGRTLTDVDQGGVEVVKQWTSMFNDGCVDCLNNAAQPRDLVLKTIDNHNAAGAVVSSTQYDGLDRPVASYGPGPASEFTGATPTAPVSRTAYDEGINGLAAKWYDSPGAVGQPKLYSTSSGQESWGTGSPTNTGAFPGVTLPADKWAGTLTGQLTGTGQAVGVRTGRGRLFVDDVKVADTWDGAYKNSILSDGPAGYWRLDEGAGTVAADATGSNPGVYTNDGASVGFGAAGALATMAVPDPNSAVTLTNTSSTVKSRVEVPIPAGSDSHPLDLRQDMTIEAWIYPTSTTGTQVIASHGNASDGSTAWDLRLEGTQLAFGQHSVADSTRGITAGWKLVSSPGSTIPLNAWTRVAAVRKAGTVTLWVGAVGAASMTKVGEQLVGVSTSLSGVKTVLGARSDGTSGFNGRLDEVSISRIGLSSARLNAHQTAATGAAVELSTANGIANLIRNDGPSLWWRMNGGAATGAVDDASDGDASGTSIGSPTATTGRAGDANGGSQFNGSSQSYEINFSRDNDPFPVNPDIPDLAIVRPVSVEAWFKTSSPGGILGVDTNGSGGVDGQHVPLMYVDTTGKLKAGFSPMAQYTSANPVTDGAWHHVVLASSGSAVEVYLDGTRIGVQTGTALMWDMMRMTVGRANTKGWLNSPAAGWAYMNGAVDEVAVYPYVLSAAQVRGHHLAGRLGSVPSGPHRIRVDVQDLAGSTSLSMVQGQPGSSTALPATQLSPLYNLVTSTTDPDGNVVKNEYQYPELGLQTATVADPNGLALRTESTFEAAGTTGYRRLLQTRLPEQAGTSTGISYSYWAKGATSSAITCATPVGGTAPTIPAGINQAGALSRKTSVDPDGSGSTTAQTEDYVYYGDGLLAAKRKNSDPWTCFTYDGRGRLLKTIYPAYGAQTAVRTVTNTVAVGG